MRLRRAFARTRRAAVAALGLTIGSALLLAGPADADAAFTLTASAQGISTEVANESIPLVASVQANTPTAQATLNSRGQASSYSAAPDPGQDVAELPGVGASQLCAILIAYGANVPGCDKVAPLIPAYPYAYAQTGDKPQDKSFAGSHLHADATETSSEGQTVTGASGAGSATATARTATASDGSESAIADASVDALTVGDVLSISGVHSNAEIQRDSGGKLTLSSSFTIGHIAVNGLQLGYDNGTFVVLGTQIPVPVPINTVLAAFKAVGITATFLPALATTHGVASEGLSLSWVIPGSPTAVVPPLPLPLPIGVGVPTTPTTVTYVLGRASVDSSYHAIPPSPAGIIGPSAFPTTSTPTTPATGGASTPASVTNPDTGIVAPTTIGEEPSTPTGVAPQVAPSSGPAPTVAAAPRAAFTSNANIYLAFVITALAVFGGGVAIRYLGVRLSWTS